MFCHILVLFYFCYSLHIIFQVLGGPILRVVRMWLRAVDHHKKQGTKKTAEELQAILEKNAEDIGVAELYCKPKRVRKCKVPRHWSSIDGMPQRELREVCIKMNRWIICVSSGTVCQQTCFEDKWK